MRISIVALALTAVLAVGAGTSQAQIASPVSLTLRAGGFYPDAHIGNSTWFALGADARIKIPGIPVLGGQTVSVDYISKSSGRNLLGITLLQRFGVPKLVSNQPAPYFAFGFGYYRLKADGDEGSDTRSTVGVKLAAGIDFSKNFLVEADYHLPAAAHVAGVSERGLAITAGVRF